MPPTGRWDVKRRTGINICPSSAVKARHMRPTSCGIDIGSGQTGLAAPKIFRSLLGARPVPDRSRSSMFDPILEFVAGRPRPFPTFTTIIPPHWCAGSWWSGRPVDGDVPHRPRCIVRGVVSMKSGGIQSQSLRMSQFLVVSIGVHGNSLAQAGASLLAS